MNWLIIITKYGYLIEDVEIDGNIKYISNIYEFTVLGGINKVQNIKILIV